MNDNVNHHGGCLVCGAELGIALTGPDTVVRPWSKLDQECQDEACPYCLRIC